MLAGLRVSRARAGKFFLDEEEFHTYHQLPYDVSHNAAQMN